MMLRKIRNEAECKTALVMESNDDEWRNYAVHERIFNEFVRMVAEKLVEEHWEHLAKEISPEALSKAVLDQTGKAVAAKILSAFKGKE